MKVLIIKVLPILFLVGLVNLLYAQCGQTISAFPHNENFETTSPQWTPTTISTTPNCTTWIRRTGSTSSSNTGPSSAQSGNYYAYVEASGTCSNPPSVSTIFSPCYNLGAVSTASLSFHYHMYGNTMGSLQLRLSTNGGASWQLLWSRTGNQGDIWHQATVNLNSYVGQTIQLKFDGTVGSGWSSDMAIDNITMNGSGLSGQPDLTVSSPSAPSSATSGASITVSCTVSNVGFGNAASSTLAYYLSTNSIYDSGDTPLGNSGVASLVPNASAFKSASVSLPAGLTAGTYYILFRADDSNVVAETNENNNVAATPISIGAAPSCSDGVQNGNETGVDCGGSCPPCGGNGGSSLWTQNGSSIHYNSGNVGIGLTSPTEKLAVNGTVLAKEFRATLSYPWPDYVFLPTYDLLPLAEIEKHIHQYGHLPDIPAAAEVEAVGVSLAEMNVKLLEKIEELTLHIIGLEKRIVQLEGKD
jgi:hypothetical protein